MKTFKTKPYQHQRQALKLSQDRESYALLMEQGTGKSKVVIDTAAHLWRNRKIDTVLILAPKGVAPGWVRQQFPEHLPDDVPYVAALWRANSHKQVGASRALRDVLATEGALRVIVMNIEAFGATTNALDFAIEVLDSGWSTLLVVDESHRIKTPQAHTTKRISNLRQRATYRRILTGTIGDKPFDLFSQFGFLDPAILGVDSFTAFKSEYAEMLPSSNGLMRHIARRVPKKWGGERDADGNKIMVPAYMPTIVATNADGSPKYKNLDQLQELIAPHAFRVLKRDCLDLPEKVYSRYYTELSAAQAQAYTQVRDDLRLELEEGNMLTFNKLTAMLRLQQIICGYVADGAGGIRELFPKWEDNPRIASMLELIADRPEGEGTIIWCRFIEDIKRVSQALQATYGMGSVVQFYGDVNDKERAEAVARFQGQRQIMDRKGNLLRNEEVPAAERARFMVSQQRAGGVGQTWTAANLSLHYSNTFSLIDRLQAEDRPHRIGQQRAVQYIDIEAENTIDTTIINSLIAKKEVADVLNADESCSWLRG